jgi:uncharacterized membrane protein
MGKGLARIGLAVMAALAVGVALYSFRFAAVLFDAWPGVDAGIRGAIMRAPVQALTHMLVALIALLVGPFQFFPRLRANHPQIHRVTGRVYVAACVIAGLGGLATAPYASGGPVAGLGFGILATLWLAATLGAWRAAVRRQFALHRLLMRFSYAMTFGAVTLRLQIPLGFMLGYASYSAMSVWLAYTAWIPNVIVVALYSLATASRRPTIATA